MAAEVRTELADAVYGFHPRVRTRVKIEADEEGARECSIGLVYEDLGAELIVDQYQLRMLFDEGRLSSDAGARAAGLDLHVGAHPDLEAPRSLLPSPPPALLVIPLTNTSRYGHAATVTVPLHLRYLAPITRHERLQIPIRQVALQPPSLFRFCTEDTHTPLVIHPSARSLAALADTHGTSISVHALPSAPQPPLHLSVPVGIQDHQWTVEFTTVCAVWLAFAWISYCLWRDHRGLLASSASLKSHG